MLNKSFHLRNFVKEMICKIYDTVDYSVLHPYTTLRQISHKSTIKFILENCPKAIPCRTPKRLLDLALSHVEVEGAFLEFGVFKGASINYLAKKNKKIQIDGFDSFEGLQEAWVHNKKNAFSVGGILPKVEHNVNLHKGYFNETIPVWMERNEEKIAFLHVDCDLYSSTKTIFDYLQGRIQLGTIVVFDDYFNFPSWEEDGHRVLQDLKISTNLQFEYLGFAYKELAIKITS